MWPYVLNEVVLERNIAIFQIPSCPVSTIPHIHLEEITIIFFLFLKPILNLCNMHNVLVLRVTSYSHALIYLTVVSMKI